MKVTGTIKSLGKQLLTQRSNKEVKKMFLGSRQSLERVYSEGQEMIFLNGGRYVSVLSAGSQDNYQESDFSLEWI